LGVWDDPARQADDDELTVYGVNAGENCIIYNTSMFTLDVFFNEAGGGFNTPRGICALSDGTVLVADAGNHRIVKMHNPGRKLRYVTSFGEDVLKYPMDVAISPEKLIFVADSIQGTVFIFTEEGELTSMMSDLPAVTAVAVTSKNEYWSMNRRDLIYVVFDNHHRIRSMDHLANKLKEVWLSDLGIADYFGFIVLDLFNNLYVTDKYAGKIHKLDANLNYLDSFGETGSEKGQFMQPTGIDIYRRFGQIFIAEATGAQYYWVGSDIAQLDARFMPGKLLHVYFRLSEASYVNLELMKPDGSQIATNDLELRLPGEHIVRWTVNFNANPADSYILRAKAVPYYCSTKILTVIKDTPVLTSEIEL